MAMSLLKYGGFGLQIVNFVHACGGDNADALEVAMAGSNVMPGRVSPRSHLLTL
jgi:hypothetical protein